MALEGHKSSLGRKAAIVAQVDDRLGDLDCGGLVAESLEWEQWPVWELVWELGTCGSRCQTPVWKWGAPLWRQLGFCQEACEEEAGTVVEVEVVQSQNLPLTPLCASVRRVLSLV